VEDLRLELYDAGTDDGKALRRDVAVGPVIATGGAIMA
jgi:hypothetical protein